jgi:hypothetical protein
LDHLVQLVGLLLAGQESLVKIVVGVGELFRLTMIRTF